ncbi:MAG: hypothetical protein JWL73_2617 [Actinomycetia bacterium]|nr:hypothetical protein [Actinomycetes bacterium]
MDLRSVIDRRRALQLGGLAGAAAILAACSSSGSDRASRAATTTPGASGASGSGGTEIPEETAGPFPGDGSNGVDVLGASGIVRSDITSSFGSASGVAQGVPLAIELTVVDPSAGGRALAGAAVYVWHCDRDGNYSMYSDAAVDENYLRGVQPADADGKVRFTSIFPAAYPGRWPHIHFEIYPDVAKAATASGLIRTSQLALPEAACREVYATSGYGPSLANLTRTPIDRDMVFSDGYSLQMAKVSGSPGAGYTASLNVPV